MPSRGAPHDGARKDGSAKAGAQRKEAQDVGAERRGVQRGRTHEDGTRRSGDSRARTTSTALLLKAVNDRPISALIVDQVRTLINEGKLTPGDRLPPERELCERFGASRVTVREALRVLEARGLVEIRVGSGALVKEPSTDWVEANIVDLLALSSVTARDVAEVRMLLEVGIIPLLCAHTDAGEMAALQDICERQEAALAEDYHDMALSAEFHSCLAAATHNPAFELLIHSFRGALLMPREHVGRTASETGRRRLREHRAILVAIQSGDAAVATRIMRDHLIGTAHNADVLRAASDHSACLES